METLLVHYIVYADGLHDHVPTKVANFWSTEYIHLHFFIARNV